ncbi:hypothetical protein FWH13_02240 [Candidatus Saccharibacteria bacterium]|nr:hypothetical protein [Candidatus Saccharibacteria bacterium]
MKAKHFVLSLVAIAMLIATPLLAAASESGQEEYKTRRQAIVEFGRLLALANTDDPIHVVTTLTDEEILQSALDARLAVGDGSGNLRLDDPLTPHEYVQLFVNSVIRLSPRSANSPTAALPQSIRDVTPTWAHPAYGTFYNHLLNTSETLSASEITTLLVELASRAFVPADETLFGFVTNFNSQ